MIVKLLLLLGRRRLVVELLLLLGWRLVVELLLLLELLQVDGRDGEGQQEGAQHGGGGPGDWLLATDVDCCKYHTATGHVATAPPPPQVDTGGRRRRRGKW